MFVSVVIDPGGRESASHLAEVLTANGFERVQHACWESVTINDEGLVTLKQDIDRVTDYYDIVRLYQYPIQDVFAVTTLYKKSGGGCLYARLQKNWRSKSYGRL